MPETIHRANRKKKPKSTLPCFYMLLISFTFCSKYLLTQQLCLSLATSIIYTPNTVRWQTRNVRRFCRRSWIFLVAILKVVVIQWNLEKRRARFRYIEVLFHIFYYYLGKENRSLYRGFRCRSRFVLCNLSSFHCVFRLHKKYVKYV